jgi:four helix bundle protein
MRTDASQDIRDRSFEFGCEVARLALRIAPRPGFRCLVDQLLKAGTSVGASLEEAKAASSRRDFLYHVQISLRESRETVYWIRVCAALALLPEPEFKKLRDEGEQISRILGAIVVNTRRRLIAGCTVFAFCILNFALF